MIKAYHIIGFKAGELGHIIYQPDEADAITAQVAQRFEAIKQAGILHARCHQPRAWDSLSLSAYSHSRWTY